MNFGERLKGLRIKRGFTQKELAEKAQVAVITIQQYELEKRQPRADILAKIAFVLEVETDYFFSEYVATAGANIRKYRLSIGFTQKELGQGCNMSESQISQYEVGIRNPSYKTLEKIAAALNIPIDYFFRSMGEAQPLTLEELENRNDPVWVPISESEGYWCLCQQGRIMPPSGLGFMAKDRPGWIYYGCKPIEFNYTYEKQIECEVFNETENKGELIRKIRNKRNLTQKQLGELCGIDEANIRKYEFGKQNPRYETLEKIADALTVPISCFLKK